MKTHVVMIALALMALFSIGCEEYIPGSEPENPSPAYDYLPSHGFDEYLSLSDTQNDEGDGTVAGEGQHGYLPFVITTSGQMSAITFDNEHEMPMENFSIIASPDVMMCNPHYANGLIADRSGNNSYIIGYSESGNKYVYRMPYDSKENMRVLYTQDIEANYVLGYGILGYGWYEDPYQGYAELMSLMNDEGTEIVAYEWSLLMLGYAAGSSVTDWYCSALGGCKITGFNTVDYDCDYYLELFAEGADLTDYDHDEWIGTEDCDNSDPDIYNEAWEECDGKDNDCDDLIDEGYAVFDEDNDGVTNCEGDCDDYDPKVGVCKE